MQNLTITQTDDGHWITNWMGREHLVTLDPQEEPEFVSMGLVNLPPVRIETTVRGEIESIVDNRTGETIKTVGVPKSHFLYRSINIGKPYSR